MKKITVTIAIPAYNEEANIKRLLDALLKQNYKKIVLDKILVVSDHSTDKTAEIVKAFKNKTVKLIENNRRIGKPAVQNIMFRNTKSDYLVILDADILPDGRSFIEELIRPLIENAKAGMSGADTIPAKGGTFIEKVISDSHTFKTDLYKKINKGNNIYMCHGRGRALTYDFYSNIKVPSNCSQEDAFLYLLCRKKRFDFEYAKGARVIFKSPSTVKDHAKQSMRFSQGNKGLFNYFDDKIIEHEYKLPVTTLISEVLRFFVTKPVSAITYILIQIYILIFKPAQKTNKGAWNMSMSTKSLSSI